MKAWWHVSNTIRSPTQTTLALTLVTCAKYSRLACSLISAGYSCDDVCSRARTTVMAESTIWRTASTTP